MITFDKLIDLMPIVAHRGFRATTLGPWLASPSNTRVRDRNGRCPICALVNELDPRWDFHECAIIAMEHLFGRALAPQEMDVVMRVAFAADHAASTHLGRRAIEDRKRLLEALEVRS